MSDSIPWDYYGALIASAISSIAWILGFVGVGYTIFVTLTTGFPTTIAIGTVAAFSIGIVFALLEKRLYRL